MYAGVDPALLPCSDVERGSVSKNEDDNLVVTGEGENDGTWNARHGAGAVTARMVQAMKSFMVKTYAAVGMFLCLCCSSYEVMLMA